MVRVEEVSDLITANVGAGDLLCPLHEGVNYTIRLRGECWVSEF